MPEKLSAEPKMSPLFATQSFLVLLIKAKWSQLKYLSCLCIFSIEEQRQKKRNKEKEFNQSKHIFDCKSFQKQFDSTLFVSKDLRHKRKVSLHLKIYHTIWVNDQLIPMSACLAQNNLISNNCTLKLMLIYKIAKLRG